MPGVSSVPEVGVGAGVVVTSWVEGVRSGGFSVGGGAADQSYGKDDEEANSNPQLGRICTRAETRRLASFNYTGYQG